MTLRLKRLEIQGFKSFAARTVFDLADGLTAIVGPNGSGKSNLSEAVRWVLGEQRVAALRGRKGEDVIFAGGAGRAALGMAEVSLTLDNAGGGLPLDFNEVTITRRVFRDGETQYLINGGRVRLRDLLAAVAPLGQSYTVIGQGLVDAALSARPEERRGLFEHAAGIAPFRLKRAEAERRLAEAEVNCTRIADLRVELAPRLRALERAAQGAREAVEVRERLTGARRRLFADLWREAAAALARAEGAEREARAAREGAQGAIAGLEAEVAARRAAIEAREAERRVLAAREGAVARRLEPLRRGAAVDEERLVAGRRRLADLAQEAEAEAARAATLMAEREESAREAAAVEAALAAARAVAAELEGSLAVVERERATAAGTERQLADAAAALERERLGLARRSAAAEERRTALEGGRERLEAELVAARERAATLEGEGEALADHVRAAKAAREAAEMAEGAAAGDLAAALAAEREATTRLGGAERRLAELRARLEGLASLAASGEGFFSGPRAVLAAAREGRLGGVIGPVAALIEVPAGLEGAFEVALGGRVQDVVVERWADAEAAIALLKERRAGRATFQPLDSLRSGGDGREGALASGPGVLGVAAELVGHEERFAPLVRGLLGRTLIVEDLPTTRRVLPRLPGGWSVVTRGGEITRASGAVTGGSAGRESGAILARERALRELPVAVTGAERERDTLAAQVAEAAATGRQARDELAGRERARREAVRADEEGRARADRLARERRIAVEGLAVLERRRDELAAGVAALRTEIAERAAREGELVARLAGIEERRAAAAETLRAIGGAGEEERARLAGVRAEIARAEERRRGLRREDEGRRAREAALRREGDERVGREAALAAQERELTAALARRRSELDRLEREAAELAAAAPPLDAALAAARQAREEAAAAGAAAGQEALRLEAVLGARAVETERARGTLDALARRVAEELEVGDPAALFADPDPELTLPLPAEERAALEAQVERLAGRLRRLGPPNPDAMQEHEAEATRWRFLTEQLSDVESAIRSLRDVLADLDRTTAERFDRTFALVAEAFAESFADLFGGGSARLVLTEPPASPLSVDGSAESSAPGAPGVEIVAQPPGKRAQHLALLSGGERALTAVALLFAILRTNPSPFCVLDEVDAALDESNVVRFRERLRGLAERTQFVVITHNRGTIEGADTLYGITMGADGVSRALSLRLDGALARAGD